MIQATLTRDTPTDLGAMISGFREQLPYALALAINDTVNQAQAAIQTSLPTDFTLRRASFITNTIYRQLGRDFATKANLVGTVRVNPDRDFLAKFETEAVKTPRGPLMRPERRRRTR